MKLKWMVPLLAVLTGVSLWLQLGGDDGRRTAPPAMSAEQIRAASDAEVVSLVTTDVRWKVAELGDGRFGRWRTLPAAARHVLVLSYVERDDAPGTPPIFQGFAALLRSTEPVAPTLAEIAEAYRAIGAAASADVVTQAAQLAESSGSTPTGGEATPAQPDPFTALNRQLPRQSSTDGVIGLLRSYVRSNAEEIATARCDR